MRLFKKKPKPINPCNYDWKFEYVAGGFCHLHKLPKRKPMYAVFWLGGFKFKFFKLYKDFPTPENKEPTTYSTTLNFDSEFINNLREL